MADHAKNLKLFYEEGDKAALEIFFVDNFDLIYRISYHYTNNKADAEDVCQQVMIQVMSSISRCKGAYEGSDQIVLGWLSILTANQARLFLRTSKRNLLRENKKGIEMQMEKSEKINESSSHGHDELLEYALEKIPVLYKNAILLKYYDGLSYTEIAETLGVREVTIRSYVSRGIEQMRLLLNKKTTTNPSMSIVIAMVANRKVSTTFVARSRALVTKAINSSHTQRVAMIKRQRQKKAPILNMAIVVACVVLSAFFIFQYLKNPSRIESPDAIAATINDTPFSKSWDFSKDTGDDIKITDGSWSLDKEKGRMISADDEVILEELPFNFMDYYKLEVEAFFYGIPNGNRVFAFQPFARSNFQQQLLSEVGETMLNDSLLMTQPKPGMDRYYYQLKFFIYVFDDYLLISSDHRHRLLKTTNYQNKNFGLAIRNLEIAKMSYQPIGKEDREPLKSILRNLEKNMKDKDLFGQIKMKLQAHFAKLN